MNCPNCGSEYNEENAAFCPSCGNPLPNNASNNAAETPVTGGITNAGQVVIAGTATDDAATSQTQQPQVQQAQQPTAQPTQPTETQPAEPQQAAAQTQQPQQPVQPYQTAAQQVPPTTQPTSSAQPNSSVPPAYQNPAVTATTNQTVYAKGCITTAWEDIKQSDGWFGKTMLMGLINIVPILNWIVPGYCLRWSRGLVMGKIEKMPKDIFGERCFITGVYYFVLALVFGFVSAIAGGILGIVPLLGWIAAIAVGIFIEMFLNVSLMRAAIADRLGAGFELGKVWNSAKGNLGSLFCITFVPSLIVGIIVGIIAFVIMMIAIAFVGADIASLAYMYDDYYYDSYSYEAALAILAIIGALLPAILVVYVIACFVDAFLYLLTFRAMGHWVARYASDWMNDPAINATAYNQQGQQPRY